MLATQLSTGPSFNVSGRLAVQLCSSAPDAPCCVISVTVTKRTSHPAASDKQQDVSASESLASAAKVSPSINISRLILSVFTVRLRMHYIRTVLLSVDIRLSNACIVTKRNNPLPKFLYRIKEPFI